MAAQRAQPAASNGVTLPRLSDRRRPARGGGPPTARTAVKKGGLTQQDRENNARNIASEDVQMPLSTNGRPSIHCAIVCYESLLNEAGDNFLNRILKNDQLVLQPFT